MPGARGNKAVTKAVPVFILVILSVLLQLLDIAAIQAPRERIDGLLYDVNVSYLPAWERQVTNIHIVDIDERSLEEVGRMPWSRDKFAQLSAQLTELGAIVISFDILFAEAQINPAQHVFSHLAQQNIHWEQADQTLSSVLQHFDYDNQFVRALSQQETVFSSLLHKERLAAGEAALQKGVLSTSDYTIKQPESIPEEVPRYAGFSGVLPKFAQQATGVGFMNSFEDGDGFVRRAGLLANVNGALYPSLALETYRVYSLLDSLEPVVELHNDTAYMTGLYAGNQFIATDTQGKILIPYKGARNHYPYTSATDVINYRIKDKRFDQAVVFIGTSAVGLADLRSTPVGLGFPGVEIQATLFDALLHPETIPLRPDWWREALLVELLLIGGLCLWLLTGRSPHATTGYAVLILVCLIGIHQYLWLAEGWFIALTVPVLLTIALSIYFIGGGFFAESRRRQQVKAIFDQYVPPAHIDRMLNDPSSLSLAGERKQLTVMFSDIRSFTSISEAMTASDLKAWLNDFFSPITASIFHHDGTIDKYVGDMVMAFWGAPLDEPAHATKAIYAAFDMLDNLHGINEKFVSQHKPQANIGIGINTGEMNVGDMGSTFRRSYTVIGDAVNLGSRLEGLTKFYGVDILVSEFTRQQAPEFHYYLVDKVRVKGKKQPVSIYCPLKPNSEQHIHEEAAVYNTAIAHYYRKAFDIAYETLSSLGEEFAQQQLRHLFMQRCTDFLTHPPGADWDGAFTHSSK